MPTHARHFVPDPNSFKHFIKADKQNYLIALFSLQISSRQTNTHGKRRPVQREGFRVIIAISVDGVLFLRLKSVFITQTNRLKTLSRKAKHGERLQR